MIAPFPGKRRAFAPQGATQVTTDENNRLRG
jgi:hypothetical protein